jgi:type I restriction enzyme S subunit
MQQNLMHNLDLTRDQLAIVLDILSQHALHCTVCAVGSRVTGNARPYSDLDLMVVGNEPLSLEKRAEIAEAFDESDLPFKVDIVDWARTDEGFREIVSKNKIILRP